MKSKTNTGNAPSGSDQLFQSFIKQTPVAIQIHSLDGKLIESNPAFSQLHGLSEDALAELYEKYNILKDKQAFRLGVLSYVKSVFAGETLTFPEYKYDVNETLLALDIKNAGSKICWIKTQGFPLKDDKGNITQAVFISEDITTHKKAEIELNDSRLFTDNLIQSANAMIVGIDVSGKVNVFNHAAERISGYTFEDIKDKDWFATLVPKEKYPDVHSEFNRLLTGGIPRYFENPIVTKNGEERIISWTNNEIIKNKQAAGLISFGIDITEQKIAERALIDSENKFRALFNRGGYAMSYAKLDDGLALMANQAWLDLFGYESESDVLGKLAINFLIPEERARVAEYSRRRLSGEAPNYYITRGLRKDGSTFDLEMRVHVFEMKEEKYALAMMNDVTDRIKAEEEINQLYHLSSDLIGIAGFDGYFSQLNPAWEAVLGYTTEELKSKPFYDFIHPDDIQKTDNEVKLLSAGRKALDFENRYIHKDGTIRHISWTATPILEKRILYCIGHDITKRKVIEDALAENEEKFRLLVEQSPLPILIFNPDGFLDKINLSWQKMWGLSDEELQQVLAHYNVLKDEMLVQYGQRQLILKAFNGEPIVLPLVEYDGKETMDRLGKKVNAKKRWILASYYPVKNQKGEVVKVVGMVDDLTESKSQEEEILNYQKRLQDLALELTFAEEKQRKQIATDLHDDVGQMLASSRIQIATIDHSMDKAIILEKVKDVSIGLRDAITATQQAIFELRPPQLSEIGLEAALSDWMEEELELKHGIKAIVNGKNEKFEMNDEVRYLLFRCVRELLINVIKHSQASQVTVDIAEKNDVLTISVSDNGVGFIYNPASGGLKGSGFGLFSIRERIQNIGGSLKIHATIGSGTKIFLSLPFLKK